MAAEALYADPRFAGLYDAENPWSADCDFVATLAAGATSVLDLGCGTGTLLLGLDKGLARVGVDPAAAMLKIARGRPGGNAVTWLERDARTLRLERRFDLVVLTGHAFQVFLTEADQAAVLATIAAHLSPAGRFVFDTRNPLAREWEEWTPEASRRSFIHPLHGEVESWNDVDQDRETGVVRYGSHFRFANGVTINTDARLRFSGIEELDAMIAAAGLGVDTWLGDWSGERYTPASREIIPVGGFPCR